MIHNPFIKTLAVILIIMTLLAGSCAPKTRTIRPLSKSDRAEINKLAIYVQSDEELEANISRMKTRYYSALDGSNAGMGAIFIIPVLLAAIIVEESVRSNIDSKHADEFGEDISEIKIDKLLSERIDEYFDNTDAGFNAEITVLQNTSSLSQKGFDTLLVITVDKLEVKLCPKVFVWGVSSIQKGEGPPSSEFIERQQEISRWNEINPKYYKMTTYRGVDSRSAENLYGFDNEDTSEADAEEIKELSDEIIKLSPTIEQLPSGGDAVRTWIKFKGKIVSTTDGRVIWDREELYYDPKCERVQDMQNIPELVVSMLTRAIGDIAVNTVNEIK